MAEKLPVNGTNEERVPDEYDVVDNGVIVGRDPDPNIRAAILREWRTGGAPRD